MEVFGGKWNPDIAREAGDGLKPRVITLGE
jgi:hypothetical protein